MFVAENVGVKPTTGLLKMSLREMVTEDVAAPFATTGLVPMIPEFAATAEPEVKTTDPPALATGRLTLIARAMARDNIPLATVESRLDAQLSNAERIARAAGLSLVPPALLTQSSLVSPRPKNG